MGKHTPGPWFVREVPNCNLPGHTGYVIDFNDAQEQVVDFVYEEADAQLIGAAPDLLRALELVMEDKAPGYHDCIDDGEPECAWCIARKAIAKATS